jgi:hypothetical protein
MCRGRRSLYVGRKGGNLTSRNHLILSLSRHTRRTPYIGAQKSSATHHQAASCGGARPEAAQEGGAAGRGRARGQVNIRPAEGVGGGSCLPSWPKPCGSFGRCGATCRLKKRGVSSIAAARWRSLSMSCSMSCSCRSAFSCELRTPSAKRKRGSSEPGGGEAWG